MSAPFDPDYVIAPGETLKEWLEADGGWRWSHDASPAALALRFRITGKEFDGLLAGTTEITVGLARRLQNMTGVSSRFWLALDQNFRVGLAAGKKWVGRDS